MRVGIVSDIHANLPALEAVLAALGEVDALWHLGDVVGYGPHPNEAVARLADLGAIGVMGNHDAAALGAYPDIEYFNSAAQRAIAWTREQMEPATRAWLAALPELREEDDVTLVHGSPLEPLGQYLVSSLDAGPNFAAFDTHWCLHGHTHIPAVWVLDRGRISLERPEHGDRLRLGAARLMVNPGSVGQPRDGDPRAGALVLDTDERTLTWLRVRYPIEETQAAMRAAGLPAILVERLGWGR